MAKDRKKTKKDKEIKDDSSLILGGGVALGALTVAEFALVGAVCPACVVGAPILVGIGVAKKLQDRKQKQRTPKPQISKST